jgi:predicted dehydrogenase
LQDIRIGLIGCGLFGESHLQAYRAVSNAKVTAVFDVSRDRAAAMAAEFDISRVASSLEEVCADDNIDAIDVVTPEEMHREPVLTAIAHGKHVFVEKPLATDLNACRQMIDAAAAAHRILMVGQLVRFETKFAMLKEEVASGRLGNIVSMHARRNRLKSLLALYGRTHPVVENSIHDIDLMLWYTGQRVKKVRGFERRVLGPKHAEVFWGVLEFQGGALGVVETIWLLPKAAGIMLDDAFQLVGDKGIGNVSLVPGALTFWRDDGAEVPDVSYDPRLRGAAYGALRDELAYFCDCVRHNRQPEIITAREATNSVRVALALAQSSAEGRDIEVKEWS